MPTITKIVEQKRRANRRNIYLDGKFAFGCNVNVVAKFYLREGMQVSEEQVESIKRGEIQQECFDKATEYLGQRLHSRAELYKKLMRQEYGEDVVKAVLDELARLGYVDDERFAKTKALAATQYKRQGRRRVFMELLKSGVQTDVANRALDDVFQEVDSTALARQLIVKQLPRLSRLDPQVAKRRLIGMLQRRGFDYDAIRPIIDEALGSESSD